MTEPTIDPAELVSASPNLLTVRQLADRLQVSPTWIYRHAKDWPFTRVIGKALRFDPRGLEAWLTRQRPEF